MDLNPSHDLSIFTGVGSRLKSTLMGSSAFSVLGKLNSGLSNLGSVLNSVLGKAGCVKLFNSFSNLSNSDN